MQICEIHITMAKEGMVIATDIYTDKNELVLPVNTVLDKEIIQQLKRYGIFRFNVFEEEKLQERQVEAYVPQSEEEEERVVYKEKVRKSEEFVEFKKEFDETVHGLKKTFQRMVDKNGEEQTDTLVAQVESIFKSGHGTLHVLEMLNCMREYDDVTFAHCISVAVLCHLIGEWLNFSDEEINTLTLCGALHDIGKLQISNAIISKPGKLTDEEFHKIQEHPRLGYDILKERDLDIRIKHAALFHHERCDGTGYPLGLGSNKIDSWSRIVSIADVYDAMTADRSYRKGMCPFKVLDIMQEDGFVKYDPKILMIFMEKITQSYINAIVRLSDDRIGEIISINPNALTRPLVRVGDTFVDLSRDKNLTIKEVL